MADTDRRGDDPTKTWAADPPSKRHPSKHREAHEGRRIRYAAEEKQAEVEQSHVTEFLARYGATFEDPDEEPSLAKVLSTATERLILGAAEDPYDISNGFFTQVFGRPVIKRDLDRPGMDAFNYRKGFPTGVLEHGTWGCGSDLSALMVSRGYVFCNFSIDRNGRIYQYVPLFRGTWHAHEAGEDLTGIEHTVFPETCGLTRVQRVASVTLNAAIVLAVKDLAKFDINLEHGAGDDPKTASFLEHIDGAIPDREEWDPNVHCDNPISMWGGGRPALDHDVKAGWDPFLHDIGVLTGGGSVPVDEEGVFMALTDEEQAQLYAINLWRMRGANNEAPPGASVKVDGIDVSKQAKNAWDEGQLARKAAGVPSKSDK